MEPFKSYDEYMDNIFDCVNRCLHVYLEDLKLLYSNGQGGYKSVLYPDLEIASDAAKEQVQRFGITHEEEEKEKEGGSEGTEEEASSEAESGEGEGEADDSLEEDLLSMLDFFGSEDEESEEEDAGSDLGSLFGSPDDGGDSEPEIEITRLDVTNRIMEIQERAEASAKAGVVMPFYELCRKMGFDPFTVFCFACGVLSSTQTDYAGIFQNVNENANLSSPTIESAGKLYFGKKYSITGAYGDMSVCLEQLLPVLDLHVVPSMPFSTVVSPDKRIIDYLFGRDRMKIDENYIRFMRKLTKENEELDEILCNGNVLDAMRIAYKEGSRLFSYHGDEGSGRKFFVRTFCKENSLSAITVNCKKLFVYDYAYVEKAIWAATRECIETVTFES